MTPTARAIAALTLGVIVATCAAPADGRPQSVYKPREGPWRTVVVPDATLRPTPTATAILAPRTPFPTRAPIQQPRQTAVAEPKEPRLAGIASWYCRAGRSACHRQYPDTAGFDAYAAAGPALRSALGDWRGQTVTVTASGVSVRVRLVDWCQCGKGTRGERLIDLYADPFSRLAPLSAGLVRVTVSP